MKAELITKSYILCPKCGESDHLIQHIIEEDRTFGPWQCHECKHEFYGSIKNGEVEVTKIEKINSRRMLSLLKFRDIYMVVEGYSDCSDDREDWYDYLFHSHQCPTNIMGKVEEVYDEDERDPHGLFRFVSAVEDTPYNRKELEETYTLEDLFKLYETDGTEAATNWPQENKGVLDFIAIGRGYNKKEKN